MRKRIIAIAIAAAALFGTVGMTVASATASAPAAASPSTYYRG